MQTIQFQNESVVEIATFLVRRWSGKDKTVIEISDKMETRTRLNEQKIILTPLEKRIGNDFQKYRQFRTSLWYEAMRMKFCKKILSNDHAFGFILNTMETQRVEQLGRKIWKGMDDEIIFNYAYMLVARPQLNTVYGRARIVEAFYQYFMFGAIKGEIQSSHFEKIKKASAFAKKITKKAVEKNYDTDWLEKNVSEIVKILDIDSLLTIPVSLPFMKAGMALSKEELLKILKIISKNKEGDFGSVDSRAVLRGDNVYDEYQVILDENKKIENKGLIPEVIGIQIPSTKNVNETTIYDMSLINGLKIKKASVNVKKISGLFDCKIGNILSYTSASGVDPLAIICANLFAVMLFHLILSGFIDQQTIDLSWVLNAYNANFTLRKAKTSQSAKVAFLYSKASGAMLDEWSNKIIILVLIDFFTSVKNGSWPSM